MYQLTENQSVGGYSCWSSWKGEGVTGRDREPKELQERRLMKSTWERDGEMRESLFLSPPFILRGSDRRCVSPSVPAYFGLIPPRGSSNWPSVFGQAWKRADSIQSVMTREWRTRPPKFFYLHIGSWEQRLRRHAIRIAFLQRRGSLNAKRGRERCFIGQWPADLWDTTTKHSAAYSCVAWRTALKVLKFHQLYLHRATPSHGKIF